MTLFLGNFKIYQTEEVLHELVQLSNIKHFRSCFDGMILFFNPKGRTRVLNLKKFTSSVHSYSTRQSCNRNLFVASVNTTQYGLRSLKFTGPRLWNSLPTSITNSNSLRIFRKTLKNSILNCYSI